jgi:L-phenylalanine/L-methionine N-acetyltransferase
MNTFAAGPTSATRSSTLDAFVIRAAEPSDAAAMSALMGSPGVFEGTLQTPHAAVASRVDMLGKIDTHTVRLVAVLPGAAGSTERLAGFAGLFLPHTSLRRMHARSLAITVAQEFQGQGLGDLLMHKVLDWADNWAGVLRTELTVFADNTRAIALYQSHGFVQEGVLRAYALRGGAYGDALTMARLHPQQPKLPLA